MNDKSIAAFLNARRKFIAGLLSLGGVISVSGLVPAGKTELVIQAIIGVLGAYGIHEVANDSVDFTPAAHAA